jgi:hypothetical protein
MRVTFRHNLGDGSVRGQRDILLEAGDAETRLKPDSARIRLNDSTDDLQECRFPGAIPPDHGNPLARLYSQRDAIEERQMSKRDGHSFECDQGHLSNVQLFQPLCASLVLS